MLHTITGRLIYSGNCRLVSDKWCWYGLNRNDSRKCINLVILTVLSELLPVWFSKIHIAIKV